MLDNVLLPFRLSKIRAQRAVLLSGGLEQDAHFFLERMQLPAALWNRQAALISVGQQQRVAAARALVGQPELLICDEPTSALKEVNRQEFMALLLQACTQAASTLVFVSHDERLAVQFTQKISLVELNQVHANFAQSHTAKPQVS